MIRLPCKKGGKGPGEQADEHGPCLSADIASPQGFTDGVISLEGYGKNSEHRSVGHSQLDEGHSFTCKQKRI